MFVELVEVAQDQRQEDFQVLALKQGPDTLIRLSTRLDKGTQRPSLHTDVNTDV